MDSGYLPLPLPSPLNDVTKVDANPPPREQGSTAAAGATSIRRDPQRHLSGSLAICGLTTCGAVVLQAGPGGMCAQCDQISYCCKQHQREDWPNHRTTCIFYKNLLKQCIKIAPWAHEGIRVKGRTYADNVEASFDKKITIKDKFAAYFSFDKEEDIDDPEGDEDIPMLMQQIPSPYNPTWLFIYHEEGRTTSFEYEDPLPALLERASPYEEIFISKGMTMSMAGGLIQICCTDFPMRIKARLMPMHRFNTIADQLTKEGVVIIFNIRIVVIVGLV